MAANLGKFEFPLFDGKTNFTLWQSSVQDLLVLQGLDQALEEKRPDEVKEANWQTICKKAVSIIRSSLAPEIKYDVLKETDPKKLWEKLEKSYASKSLTNRLCLKMELYSLKMNEGMNLHNHLNDFNRLVSQLLNMDEKLEDEEKSLLLLSSLPKSYKSMVQTLLVGKSTLVLDEVVTVLRESQKLMGEESNNIGEQALIVEGSNRGRSQWRDNNRGRSRSRPRDYSDKECYYCGEKGHIQYQCRTLKEDMKSLRKYQEKEKIEDANLLSEAEEEVVLTAKADCNEDGWVLDSAASMHICKERDCFENLKVDGEFGYVHSVSKERVKIEGVGSVRFKLHDGSTKILEKVCYVPSCGENIISLGELSSRGYTYVGQGDSCKVFKEDKLILQGKKNGKLICVLDGQSLRGKKTKKDNRQVKFKDEVEIFGDSSRGRNC